MKDSFRRFTEKYVKESAILSQDRWGTYKDKPIEEVLEAYVKWHIARYKQENEDKYGTLRENALNRRRKVRPFFKDTGIQRLNEVTIEYRKAHKSTMMNMIKNGQRKRNYVSTILSELNLFFCTFLGREDLKVESIKKTKRNMERLTREDFDNILKALKEREDIPIAKRKLLKAIIVFSGMKHQELEKESEIYVLKILTWTLLK